MSFVEIEYIVSNIGHRITYPSRRNYALSPLYNKYIYSLYLAGVLDNWKSHQIVKTYKKKSIFDLPFITVVFITLVKIKTADS